MFVTCGAQGGDDHNRDDDTRRGGGASVDRAAAHAALDRVLDAAGASSGPVLADALVAAHELSDVIDGARVGLVAGFEASMEWAAATHRSPVSWMVAETGIARRAAGNLRRVCLGAHRLPHVAAAARAGRLSHGHLQLLVDARAEPVVDLFDRDEAALVQAACELTVDALRLRLTRWRHDALVEAGRNEPDGPEPPGGGTRARLVESYQGTGILDVELGPADHAVVRAGLDAEIARMRAAGQLDHDPRSLSELQGEAFMAIYTRGLTRPDTLPTPPLITATVDLDTLLRRADHDTHDRCTPPKTTEPPDPPGGPLATDPPDRSGPDDRTPRRAEITGVGPVADSVIAELAAAANIALLVTRGGQPLWYGRARRLATTAQRHAAQAASGGHCYWPGCTTPGHQCHTDHLTGWEQGGTTDIDNLAPICPFHNRLKHRHHYQATRQPDGTITVTDPRGSPITTRYHRAA